MLTMQIAPTGEHYRSPGQLIGYWDRVLQRSAAVPGVEAVALTAGLPMTDGRSLIAFNVGGRQQLPLSQMPLAFWVEVSPGYFQAMGIPVVGGREFERLDAVENPTALLINEAMAHREFSGQDPIGQRFSFGMNEDGQPQWSTIVGVVANVRQYGADQEPVAMAYGVHTGSPRSPLNLIARTAGDPRAVASSLRAALQALDPALPVSQARTLDAVVGASLTQRRFNMTLLATFAAIALVLAVAGIYGTVSYAVAQRQSEIGIRVALGATTLEILRLVLTDALKPVILGLVVGLGVAVLLTRALDDLVFGVSTTDPITFVSLAALLALVAILASLWPALRATQVDPLDALRMD
jgi:putative ABC transport system permease protein